MHAMPAGKTTTLCEDQESPEHDTHTGPRQAGAYRSMEMPAGFGTTRSAPYPTQGSAARSCMFR